MTCKQNISRSLLVQEAGALTQTPPTVFRLRTHTGVLSYPGNYWSCFRLDDHEASGAQTELRHRNWFLFLLLITVISR
jgi:hypothetical protein